MLVSTIYNSCIAKVKIMLEYYAEFWARIGLKRQNNCLRGDTVWLHLKLLAHFH